MNNSGAGEMTGFFQSLVLHKHIDVVPFSGI